MIIHNKPLLQAGVILSFTLLGSVIAAIGYAESNLITSIIGGILITLSLVGLTLISKETIIFSKRTKTLNIDVHKLWKHSIRAINAQDVKNIHISVAGKPGNILCIYYLTIILKNNETVKIFTPTSLYLEMRERENAEKWKTTIITLDKERINNF